jgi:PAS domain S-box-containing protein
MSAAPVYRLFSTATLLGLFTLAFLGTAGALMFLPGPASPLPGIGVAAMAVLGLLAIKRVMARARDTELALEEGERYIETVADLSQDIHAIIDAASRNFLYLNPAVANLLGYDQDDFTKGGLTFFTSLVHPEDLPVLKSQYEKLLEPPAAPGKETVQEQTFRLRDHRGSYRWFQSRMTVFVRHPGGKPAEFLAVIHDVTGQRSSESALLQAQEQESMGDQARGVLHDLNNALMAIQGSAEIALEGPGVPARVREHLERIQSGTARASALCRQMEAHAGSGSPQPIPPAGTAPEPGPGVEDALAPGGGEVLLLVDDEPTIRSVLRQGFEIAGFRVLEAADGVEGLGAFNRHRSAISVVLLDLTMPRMGGQEVFAEIRKLAPELPVVLMSGYSEKEATSALASQGLAGFLPKPCSIKDALGVVRKALGAGVRPAVPPG